MRKLVRKLIKESLYSSMERDLTLPSGKILPNFRGVLLSLTGEIEHAKQAYMLLEMIKEYSLMDDRKMIIKNEVSELSSRLRMVRLYFTDKEVVEAFRSAIANHPEFKTKDMRGPGIRLSPITSGFVPSSKLGDWTTWNCLEFFVIS